MSGIFPKLIVLICCAVLYDCNHCTKDTCKNFQINKKNLNKRLIGHGILETQVDVHHDCARNCFYYKLCKSFDFHRKERSCKLNNVSGDSPEATFEQKAGAIFSDITEWPCNMAGKCGERPCSKKQRCVHNKDAFQCIDITCGGLPIIPNGWAKLHASDKFNHTASVYCRKGFFTKQKAVKCQLNEKWEKATCEKGEQITDCKDLADRNPGAGSGTYEIQLWKSRDKLTVFCDMEVDGGGWTIFQNRFDGSVDFYRTFSEYENGFGDINGEFWLGLKYIQELANQGTTGIRLEMTRNNSEEGYEKYMNFKLVEGTYYKLSLNKTNSTNSFPDKPYNYRISINNGARFSTHDRDNDKSCAETRHGAWWYTSCTHVNLNGKYCLPGTTCKKYWMGLYHYGVAGAQSLKKSRMLIRRT